MGNEMERGNNSADSVGGISSAAQNSSLAWWRSWESDMGFEC